MATEELEQFLRERCKEIGISLRKLSVNSGLSPGTVHNIINRQYQPTVFTLNRLADHLRVKRQYLWQLAGLLEDMDYKPDIAFSDPRLRFLLAQVDKLPENSRILIAEIIENLVGYFHPTDKHTDNLS